MSGNEESDILRIIEKLVKSGKKTLDENLIKELKKICKISDRFVCSAYYVLMTQLRKEHSEVRYSALLIINELFSRSACFRQLLETDLDEFLELVVETDPENPLPLPLPSAKALKLKGLELIQAWAAKFGDKYARLQLAVSFLKNCKKVDFNDVEARSVVQRQQQQQEQERLERIQSEKISKVKAEMQDMESEISSTLMQMENCFRLLVPHPDELFSPKDFNDEFCSASSEKKNDLEISPEEEDNNNPLSSLRQHGLLNMKKPITIELDNSTTVSVNINNDTEPVVENLNDLHKQMIIRYFPMVSNWLKVLTKGSNCVDILKKTIDLKQKIESVFKKYKDLNCKIPDLCNDDDDDEDDDFVEVSEKDGFETEVEKPMIFNFSSEPSCSKDVSDVEKARAWKLKHSVADVKDPTTAASTLSKIISKHNIEKSPVKKDIEVIPRTDVVNKKSKLLDSAPVVPYGIDLYHWEEEKLIVPERVKFDSLHKFWESKNDDDENEVLNQAQIASIRTRKIDFSGKFEPVKFSCRAPLSSGKLCPRKDRYKCPFHGKIIKRDNMGNPVNSHEAAGCSSATTTTAVPEWQDPQLLRDIEAATGIDLKVPEKGKRKKKEKDGLTNIKKIQTSTRDRLNKKILKRYKHYASKLDDMERKKFNDKFGDQWNYY